MSTVLLNEDAQRKLWARASTLDERLSAMFEPVRGDEDEASERFAAWRMLVAGGDPERFRRRLEFDGLDESHVLSLLGAVVAKPDVPTPAEFRLLAEVVEEASRSADEQPEAVLADLPVGESYGPPLRVARKLLHERLGPDADRMREQFGPRVWLGCEQWLVERLRGICSKTHYAELERERNDVGEQGCYRRVLDRVRGEGLVEFFLEHAALARALAVVIQQWAETCAELLRRLQTDADDLVVTFGAAARGRPVELSIGLGDPHNDGRSVARVQFEGGLDVYYKPRDPSLELAFVALLDELVDLGAPYEIRVPLVLARPGYSWVEGVVPAPVTSEEEVELFFERGGALLCMAYLLDITDCHSGNLIAHGAHPMLVDLETVCHHRARDLDERYSNAEFTVRTYVGASVLGTCLLPSVLLEHGARVELGGLSTGYEEVYVDEARWTGLGTDGMRREVSCSAIPMNTPNQLYFEGRIISVYDHCEAVLRGFERTYRFLESQRGRLSDSNGPLAAFRACRARFVFRATLVYGSLLRRAASAELSRDGIDRSLLFDVLARSFLTTDERPSIWPMLRAERSALERLDVPHFTTSASSATLEITGAGSMSGYLISTAEERMQARLAGFGARDLNLQRQFIRAALARPLQATTVCEPCEPGDVTPADTTVFRNAALEIGSQLWDLAVHGNDGSVTWIDTHVDMSIEGYVPRVIPTCLGDGVAGILLFAAALEHVCGPSFATQLRVAALRHLELGIAQVMEWPVGGLTGASSVAYALAKTAELSGDEAALQLAARIVDQISIASIEADTVLDVSGGVAGTLLCLAAVREVAERYGLLALVASTSVRIRACGERLQKAATASRGAIPTVKGQALTGLSHGQAGFALAIACLRSSDGAGALQGLYESALEFERCHFDPRSNNWADRRPDAISPCSCKWCHGAPGIGVARAALLDRLPYDGRLREELEIAAQTTAAEPLSLMDHLCCGNMGRAHSLQLMGRSLHDAGLELRGRDLAAIVVARAKRRGGYHTLLGEPATQQSLGLFSGLAGIGYACLHLCDPALPSPLTFS